jgi:hypothetical protein
MVDQMAAAGRPQLDLSGGQVKVWWPDVSEYSQGAPVGSAGKLLAWLFRDRLMEAVLQAFAPAIGDDADDPGIPLGERPGREQVLPAHILKLERDEEALVEQALAAGHDVRRRADMDPMALLAIGWKEPQEAALSADEPAVAAE